jgi:NAD(P) transhydrogenase
MTESFDFVVIGSGPAGEKAAAQASYFGKRVAIVERSPAPGGAAVSHAGVPTKTFREAALYMTGFRHREVYGLSLELTQEVVLERLRSRTEEIVETMTEAVRLNLARHEIELVHGEGRLGPDRTVIVRGGDGTERVLEAEAVLIATGSRPLRPTLVPFEDPDVYDSERILFMSRIPESMVVVGGGAVACEYASILNALGTRITLVDPGPRLLPVFDAELSEALVDVFRREAIEVRLDERLASVLREGDRLAVTFGGGDVLHVEAFLFAAGRIGNTENLGLEEADVKVDARGRILVDSNFRTGAEGIYAAGDVIGPPALASVSMEQGRVAACDAFDIPFKETVDSVAPFGVYSIPEVAMVGLTEHAAAGLGIEVETGRWLFADNTRAVIAGSTQGMLKLVFRRDDRRLLGVHILGELASELIHQGQLVLHHEGTIDHFIHTTYNVPTWSEAYKYAAYNGLQRLSGRVGAAHLGRG